MRWLGAFPLALLSAACVPATRTMPVATAVTASPPAPLGSDGCVIVANLRDTSVPIDGAIRDLGPDGSCPTNFTRMTSGAFASYAAMARDARSGSAQAGRVTPPASAAFRGCIFMSNLHNASVPFDQAVRPTGADGSCPAGWIGVVGAYDDYVRIARSARSGSLAATPSPSSTARVSIEESQFEPTIRFVSASIRIEGASRFSGLRNRTWLLRSWLDRRSGAVTHQLYVSDIYRDHSWWFWTRANDDSARALRFVSIDREVISCAGGGGCSYSEVYGASLDDASLRASVSRGLSVKFYARNGEEHVVSIPADVLRAQFEAIDARRPRPAPRLSPAPTPQRRSDPGVAI
jgi:hypothetical protein